MKAKKHKSIFITALLLAFCLGCQSEQETPTTDNAPGPSNSGPSSTICELQGAWLFTVEKVETSNPSTPCPQQDCGHGAHPSCGSVVAATATTNQMNEINWDIPLAGLTGYQWSGTFNGAMEFDSEHEFFSPNSTFQGAVDKDNDCQLEGVIIWDPGTCYGEVTLTGIPN